MFNKLYKIVQQYQQTYRFVNQKKVYKDNKKIKKTIKDFLEIKKDKHNDIPPSKESVDTALQIVDWIGTIGSRESKISVYMNGLGGISFECFGAIQRFFLDIEEDGRVYFDGPYKQ